MTKEERLAATLAEVRGWLARDGFPDQLRGEMPALKNHPGSAEGNALVDAALAELAAELNRLEGGRASERAP